jgi:scyllo-inosamine-4-phosphate amidinotransferase 1
MSTSNEWSKLKKVVVGIANNAKIPIVDRSSRVVNYSHLDLIDTVKVGRYPKKVIEETNEDLEILSNFLKKLKIEVVRPLDNDPLYYNYCPRDSVLTYKDLNIACPMPITYRKNEWLAYQSHLSTGIVDLTYDHSQDLYDLNSIKNPSILAINETEPAFDAANIIKSNDDLLYLVSNSGNKKGAELLQTTIGNRGKVRLLENVYSYMHIDSTVAFLREGLALVNPERIKNKNQLPFPFNTWDIIFAPEPADIGHYNGYCNSSKWINVNLLSVDSDLVILEEHQKSLAKILKKYKIDSAMLPLRHAITLGGCFHCVTLDLERE